VAWIIAIITWVAFAIVAGFIAQNKGRSFFGFLLLSLILSPVTGVLAAFGALPNTDDKIYAGELKWCRYCGESFPRDAIECCYCEAAVWQSPPSNTEPRRKAQS